MNTWLWLNIFLLSLFVNDVFYLIFINSSKSLLTKTNNDHKFHENDEKKISADP
jgi:hypothetical protein